MDSRVAEVVETVANELTADLSVAALSRRVNLSPSRLAHLFKQDMHLPLKAYVRSRRLIHATVLLTSTSLTVKEVAYEVGYVNARHFSRMFKHHFGYAPYVSRKKQK